METVAGVFPSRESAVAAAGVLSRAGFADDRINLLFPNASEEQVHSVPTADMEQPGMGKAIGGLVGAALGMAGGMELGVAVASAVVPGVGPVMAVGLAAAAVLGVGGGIGGAAVGAAVDEKASEGLPADEIFFYEDALRKGRSVVFVQVANEAEAELARGILSRAGAESMDAAREAWWIGLRSAEEEHYRTLGGSFARDESPYRLGFEAALRRELRGKSHAAAAKFLRSEYADVWDSEAFRRGWERGQAYQQLRQGARPGGAAG
jgi:hypothetical protein